MCSSDLLQRIHTAFWIMLVRTRKRLTNLPAKPISLKGIRSGGTSGSRHTHQSNLGLGMTKNWMEEDWILDLCQFRIGTFPLYPF